MKRWAVGLRGAESGRLQVLTFATFWRRSRAVALVDRLNARGDSLVTAELVDRRR